MKYAFNLSCVAAHLPADPAYDRCRKLVKTVASVESTISDLEDCTAAILSARKLMSEEAAEPDATRLEALMVYAVITYARATHSTPIDRFPVGAGRRPEHLRETHTTIVRLRNRVLAHYGHGADQPGGPWRDEPLIMETEGDQIRFGFPSELTTFRQRVIDDIAELTDIAVPQLQQSCAAKQGELAEEVERLGLDEVFVGVAQQHRFDQNAFFQGCAAGPSSLAPPTAPVLTRPSNRPI